MEFHLIPAVLVFTILGSIATGLSPARSARGMALAVSLPALAATSWMLWKVGVSGGGTYYFETEVDWIPAIGAKLHFAVDGLSASLAWLTALLTPLVIIYSWNEAKQPKLFFSMLVLLDATVLGVFTSLDLLLFYVFWEFVLIPMYLLIAIWGGPNRRYASTKFFVYTGGASLVMLLGFMALYFGSGGSLDITDLTGQAWTQGFALTVFSILAFGFLVKLPAVPFHTWLPDAHVQAPTAGSVMLAGVLLKMGSYGLMRIAFPIFPEAALQLQWLFYGLGAAAIVYGAFLCLAQDDLKSLIAYSSVSHMGMITIALATFTAVGWAGAAYMNVAHGVISAGMFMAAGSLQHSTGTRLLSRLGGIGTRVPVLLGLTLTLFLASLGLPGMMGFIAEWTIFIAVWEAFGHWIWIPIWSILITAGYYLWAIQRAFHGPEVRHQDVDWDHIHDVPAVERYTMFALVVVAIVFGVVPGLLMGQYDDWTTSVLSIMGVH